MSAGTHRHRASRVKREYVVTSAPSEDPDGYFRRRSAARPAENRYDDGVSERHTETRRCVTETHDRKRRPRLSAGGGEGRLTAGGRGRGAKGSGDRRRRREDGRYDNDDGEDADEPAGRDARKGPSGQRRHRRRRERNDEEVDDGEGGGSDEDGEEEGDAGDTVDASMSHSGHRYRGAHYYPSHRGHSSHHNSHRYSMHRGGGGSSRHHRNSAHYSTYQPNRQHPHNNQYSGRTYYDHRSRKSGRFVEASESAAADGDERSDRKSSSKGFLDYLKDAFGGYGPDRERDSSSSSGKKDKSRRRADEESSDSDADYGDDGDVIEELYDERHEKRSRRKSDRVRGGGRESAFGDEYDDADANEYGEEEEDAVAAGGYGERQRGGKSSRYTNASASRQSSSYAGGSRANRHESSSEYGGRSSGAGRMSRGGSADGARRNGMGGEMRNRTKSGRQSGEREGGDGNRSRSSAPSYGNDRRSSDRGERSRGSGGDGYGGGERGGRGGAASQEQASSSAKSVAAGGGYAHIGGRCCDPCTRPKPDKRCCPPPPPKCCDPAALYENDGYLGGAGHGGDGRFVLAGGRRGRACSLRAGGNGRGGNSSYYEDGGRRRSATERGRPRAVSARTGSAAQDVRDRSRDWASDNLYDRYREPESYRRPSPTPRDRMLYYGDPEPRASGPNRLQRRSRNSLRPMYVSPPFIFDDDQYFEHRNVGRRFGVVPGGEEDDDEDGAASDPNASYDESDPIVPPFFRGTGMSDKAFTRRFQLRVMTDSGAGDSEDKQRNEYDLAEARYFREVDPAPHWNKGGRPDYERGNMYVSKPRGDGSVWERTARQSYAVVNEITREAFRKAVLAHDLHYSTAITFVVDAAFRVAAAIHRGEPAGVKNPLPQVFSRDLGENAPLLEKGPVTPAKGLTASVLRDHFGAVIMWPHFRAAAVAYEYLRYALVAMLRAEVFLGARSCNESTTLSGFDLDVVSACFTCGVVAAAEMVRYLYKYVARGLHPDSSAGEYADLLDADKYSSKPMGSDLLVMTESLCLGELDGRGDLQMGVASIVVGAYVAARSVVTEVASDYSETSERELADRANMARERAITTANLAAFLQRFLGHLNTLLCHLAVASMYHGMNVKVRGNSVAIYDYLTRMCKALYEPQSVGQFVEKRDAAMRDLGLAYAPGNPPRDDDNSLTLMDISNVGSLRVLDAVSVRAVGPLVPFTEAMSGYAEAVLGAETLAAAKDAMHFRKIGGKYTY